MRYKSDMAMSDSNPFATGAAVGAGAGAVLLNQKLKSAKSMASWGLGIGVALTALSAVSSSDLNADQSTAQNLATTAQGLTMSTASTATLATLADDVQRLRSLAVQQASLTAQVAYDANWWSFSGKPATQPAPVQSGPITAAAASSTSNNNAVIILAIAALVVVLAIAY